MAHLPTSLLKFDEEYYWELVTFLVDGHLFRVPKHNFIKHSKFFALKYLVGDGRKSESEDGGFLEGRDPLSRAIPLDVEVEDFRCFLKVLYPRSKGLPKHEWLAVLKLSHEWSFLSYRQMAIETLEPLMDPFAKIQLGKEYHIAAWVILGLVELVTRGRGVSRDEAKRIGWGNAIDLFNIREAYIASTSTSKRSDPPLDVEAAVTELFHSDIAAVSEQEASYLAEDRDVDEARLRAAALEERLQQQEWMLLQGKNALKALKDGLSAAEGDSPPASFVTALSHPASQATLSPSRALESAPVQVVYPAIKLEQDTETALVCLSTPTVESDIPAAAPPLQLAPPASPASNETPLKTAGLVFPPNKSPFAQHPPSALAAPAASPDPPSAPGTRKHRDTVTPPATSAASPQQAVTC